MLDDSIRSENQVENCKAMLWEWVKSNIAAKPKSKFPDIRERRIRPAPPIAAEPAPTANLITRYFQPVTR